MAAILIVEDDKLTAGRLARTLREAGHSPILAPDARAALEKALDGPDLVLLDLGSPDLPGEELLGRLTSQPETAPIPVVVLLGERAAAAHLRAAGKANVATILCKPVASAQLREAVESALARRQWPDDAALRVARERQRELILRLIVHGPNPLAFHVSRRLCADRVRSKRATSANALSWTEIADWGKREGLLNAEEARLLRRVPLATPQSPRRGTA